MKTISDFNSFFNKYNYTILNVYIFGSSLYKYKNPSDEDYLVVIGDDIPSIDIKHQDNDIKVISIQEFEKNIKNHEILSLECIFQDKRQKIIENFEMDFNLNKTKLRKAISAKASNSFVKAKKKLNVKESYNLLIAQKSIFHAIRILDFGIQIAKNDKIHDYQSVNHLWQEIVKAKSWDQLEEIRKKYKEKKSEFKKVCPLK